MTPQHMQALMLHLEERFRENRLAARPYNWGISRLEIDRAALKNFRFKVHILDAELDDGTRVRIPDETDVPVRDLTQAFEDGGRVLQVYLAVPELKPRSPNIPSDTTDAAVTRYQLLVSELTDENTGSDPRAVEFRRLQARILLGSEDTAGYYTLPLAHVTLSGEADPVPTLVPSYVPPMCRVAASDTLHEMLKDLTNMLGAKSRALGEQTAERRITFGGEGGGGDAEMLWKLYVVNGALAVFRQLIRTPSLHPFDAYLALNRLIGELAIFDRGRVPPQLPEYDPLDLGARFEAVIQHARRLVDAILPTSFMRRAFDAVGEGLRCPLDEAWIARRATFFIGIESDLEEEVIEKRMRVLKLGAPRDVSRIRSDRLSGIDKVRVSRVPTELPDRENLRYWQVQPHGDFWTSAQEERCVVLFGNRADDPACRFSLYVLNEQEG